MQVIYIDVLILENVLLNYLILYLVNRFCRLKRKTLYIYLSAFIGAMYVFIVFFPNLNFLYSISMKISVSALMIVIAFWPKNFKTFIKLLLFFYSIAFILGGAIFSIFYLSNNNVNISNGVMVLNKMSSKYLIIGIIIAIFTSKIAFDLIDRYYDMKSKTVELKIINQDKNTKVTALLDTGNSLKDPILGEPIIVIDLNYIKDIIPEELIDVIENNKNIQDITNRDICKRIRVIPYTALGTENGILIGYKVDYIYVFAKKGIGVIHNPILALYNKHLSNKGDYQAIAYPEIINWEG